MADPLESVLNNVDKGDYLKVLIGFLVVVVGFLWRQNVWLTKEVIRLASESNKVLEGLQSELRARK